MSKSYVELDDAACNGYNSYSIIYPQLLMLAAREGFDVQPAIREVAHIVRDNPEISEQDMIERAHAVDVESGCVLGLRLLSLLLNAVSQIQRTGIFSAKDVNVNDKRLIEKDNYGR